MFLANYAKYGLIPASNVASGPNLITKDKAAQVVKLSAEGHSLSGAFARGEFMLLGGVVASVASPTA